MIITSHDDSWFTTGGDPSGQLTAEDVLKEFQFTIGAQTFHKDQVRTTSRQSGATKVMLMSFDQEVEVESETRVNMSMEMVADPSDGAAARQTGRSAARFHRLRQLEWSSGGGEADKESK